MFHNLELIVGAAGLVLTLAMRVVTVNRLIRSKLRLSVLTFAAALAMTGVLSTGLLPSGTASEFLSIAHLLLALGVVTLVVVSAVNPWRVDRTPEQFPNIVQDTIIIGIFLVIGTGVMQEKFLTTSAVGAVVIGFALQDTLGNTFAGLAIQVEKPFRVEHWVRIGSFEGRVAEITWRATRLSTKNGESVIVPNSVVSKEPIINYSEPESHVRLSVDVGASYLEPPNRVKQVVLGAVADCALVLQAPPPLCGVLDFGASAVQYRVKFWIADWAQDDAARDQVRTAIYYAFRRHNIEIPYPTQVEYQTHPPSQALTSAADRREFIEATELFRPLPEESRDHLAEVARERLFGNGETIVHQDEAGDSLFVVGRGTVRVTIAPGRTEVAKIPPGGYFGEMSLLTGQPRTASVSAIGDCLLLEISTAEFRTLVQAHPVVLEQVTALVAEREAGLARSREVLAAAVTATDAPRSFLLKVREFLKL